MTVSRPIASQIARNVCKNIAILSNEGGLSLPPGAIGAWYAENYVTSPRKAIPNAVSSNSVSANLVSATRRLFANASFFTNGNVTVTDRNATAQDGTSDASTVVWGSVDGYVTFVVNTLPAGTYTLAIDVATTDGSSVNFRMGPTGSETTKTATTSWQSFSVTFTKATTGYQQISVVRSVNSSTPANLKICGLRLYSGSSDLGESPIDGHMTLAANAFDTQTVADGTKWVPSSSIRLTQFTHQTLSSWSVFACVKRNAVNTYWHAILGNVNFSWAPLCSSDYLVQSGCFVGGSERVAGDAAFWTYDSNYHVIGYTYDGTTITSWIDGCKESLFSLSSTSINIGDLWDGILNAGNYPRYDFNSVVLFPSALSKANAETTTAYLKQRAEDSSFTVGNPRFICAEGDSITSGYTDGSDLLGYVARFAANSNPTCNGTIRSTPGASLSLLSSRASQIDDILPLDKRGKQYVFSVMIGANDLGGISGSTYASSVGAYCLARKNAGWDKVVLVTPTPRAGGGSFNTNRAAYLAIVRGTGWAAANGIDAICDFAADATMGPDAAASDTALYPDGLHPSPTGHANLEPIYRATINGL